MGGSGGGWNSIGNIRALEEKAKAALQGGKKNVFISFSTEDMNEVNLLRAQAKNDNSDIEFNDHSIRAPYNSDQAEYIKTKDNREDFSEFNYSSLPFEKHCNKPVG